MFLKPNIRKMLEQDDIHGLISAVRHKDERVSAEACDALVSLGEKCVPHILDKIKPLSQNRILYPAVSEYLGILKRIRIDDRHVIEKLVEDAKIMLDIYHRDIFFVLSQYADRNIDVGISVMKSILGWSSGRLFSCTPLHIEAGNFIARKKPEDIPFAVENLFRFINEPTRYGVQALEFVGSYGSSTKLPVIAELFVHAPTDELRRKAEQILVSTKNSDRALVVQQFRRKLPFLQTQEEKELVTTILAELE